MSEITLESLAADIATLKAQMAEVYITAPREQAIAQAEQAAALAAANAASQELQALQAERSFLSQLQMEGYSKADAIAYYNRMRNGEKPWLD